VVAFYGDECSVLTSLARNMHAGKAAHNGSSDNEPLVRFCFQRLQNGTLICVDPRIALNLVHALELKLGLTIRRAFKLKFSFNPPPPAFALQRAGQRVIWLGIERQRRRRKPEVIERKG
jgi:hypothetical protein